MDILIHQIVYMKYFDDILPILRNFKNKQFLSKILIELHSSYLHSNSFKKVESDGRVAISRSPPLSNLTYYPFIYGIFRTN